MSLTNSITIDGREFEIEEPNALHLVRLLAIVGKVGTRAENVAANMGKKLLSQVIPDKSQPASQTDLAGAVFPFLAALTPNDMLALMSALLQFDDEQDGVRWLKKHPPKLNDVVQAIAINLQHTDGIVEAIRNFTQTFTTLRLAGLITEETPEAG